jgi:uncharacterized SAM-binding protein YcdF (DUF218 family)
MREEHAATDHASDGVMPLLFAMFCLAIAAYCFVAVFIAVHIWLAATVLLRLCEGKFVRAALWLCAGIAELIWWDGRYSWDVGLPLYITLVGAGVIASAYRYSKRFRQTAVPAWTPSPDTTNVIPFVRPPRMSVVARHG